MNADASLVAILDERKQSLLDELELVHHALAAANPTEETKQWLEKLEKWHEQLHMLVDSMPEID